MENIYSVASSSSSTTYGNIMAFLKEHITQQFPMGFFKDINLASEIAYVNVRRRLGRNTLREFAKLERPFMTITPQIQPMSGDMYLYDIPLTKTYYQVEYGLEKSTLFQMISNKTDGYRLDYKINRDRIQFEVSITVDTLIQQLDLYKYMINHITWDNPYAVKTSLEAMIPREIVKQMGFLSNIDIDSEKSNQVPVILQMMNRCSTYPITYKIRNGTALDEFFMYYNAEVLMCFEDISLENRARKGFADDFYQIRFNCWVEFNLPALFALIGYRPKPKGLDVTLVSKNHDGYHDLIPLYTISNFYARYPAERNGYLYYTSFRFKTECRGRRTFDTINIKSLFEDWRLGVISQYQSNNIPMITLIDPIVLQDGSEKIADWDIDWTTYDLKIDNADDKATYCLILYINNNLFNEEKIEKVESVMNDKARI